LQQAGRHKKIYTALLRYKRVDDKDIFSSGRLWFSYVIASPFFYGVSGWVFKKYIKITADAENILKELEN
jgi:hypothetical protein